MAREGLMDDAGYHGFDDECPEFPNETRCNCCIYWDNGAHCCEIFNEDTLQLANMRGNNG